MEAKPWVTERDDAREWSERVTGCSAVRAKWLAVSALLLYVVWCMVVT